MLRSIWLQSDLFPYKLESSRPPAGTPMQDSERDKRTGGQWLRSITAYLEWQSGDSWRRASDRNSPERWLYLDAIRLLNGIIGGLPRPAADHLSRRTLTDIRVSSLASWPRVRLVDELLRLNPALTDRKILMHLSAVKLAGMVEGARAAVRLERAG